MDPMALWAVLNNLLLGVAANALTHLLAKIGGFPRTPLQREVLDGIPERLAASLELRKELAERICLLVTSNEVQILLRQIYAANLVTDGLTHWSQLESEFAILYASYTGEESSGARRDAASLWKTLIKAAESELSAQVARGVLSAHEAKDTHRHAVLMAELENIKTALQVLQNPSLSLAEITAKEKELKTQIAFVHGHIVPPYMEVGWKVPMDDLYVPPRLMHASNGRARRAPTERDDGESYQHFLASTPRAVILGDPGAGKSTLAENLCHELARGTNDGELCRRRLTPFLVILRDYAAFRKMHFGSTISAYLVGALTRRYQLDIRAQVVDYLLALGRAIVIFDGLDELIDSSDRRNITQEVEAFCNLIPAAPVLVTSRETGYNEVPLDPYVFKVRRLAPFSPTETSDYVHKWFALHRDAPAEERMALAKAFIDDSELVPDLRSNPLMLSLLCAIYKREHHLPQNRPEVLGKCARMLFTEWDKRRDIKVSLPFEEHLEPTMMFLAHWIYGKPELQSGVTEQQLVNKAKGYLLDRRFEDPDETASAARNFIEFCKGRAWVLTDMGSTADGHALFRFTHRTFLEHFAAGHLVRTKRTPSSLWKSLQPRLRKREWDVVAQMAFQIMNRQQDEAANKLLTWVINDSPEGESRLNMLSFAARGLEFMVPSPKIVRAVARACFEELVSRSLDREPNPHEPWSACELLGGLAQCVGENRPTVAEELQSMLAETVKAEDARRIVVSLLAALNVSPHIVVGDKSANDVFSQWHAFSEEVFHAHEPLLHKLAASDAAIAGELFVRDAADIADLIGWHGLGVAFASRLVPSLPNLFLPAPLLTMLATLAQRRTREQLEKLGEILLRTPMPWVGSGAALCGITTLVREYREAFVSSLSQELPHAQRIALLAALMTAWDQERVRGEAMFPPDYGAFASEAGVFSAVIRARTNEASQEEALRIGQGAGLPLPPHFLLWIQGKASTIGDRPQAS